MGWVYQHVVADDILNGDRCLKQTYKSKIRLISSVLKQDPNTPTVGKNSSCNGTIIYP